MQSSRFFFRIIILLTLCVSSPSMANGTLNLDLTFTATLRETTCDMTLEGGSGDGTNNVIPIGSGGITQLDKIINADTSATTAFKLKIVDCPSSLTKLKTTITGSASSIQTAISNSATNNAASNVGVSIARAITPDQPFEINATDEAKTLLWTSSEINAQEVPLVARLIETATGKGTTGIFSATATFNFEYE
ncbi:TPA: fimbrial protein [Citrobacter pasteurii]|uniref:fimbrial protein n=1 Tax=Citrobacter sp. Cu233 TaxID=2985160 RepID=UPI00257782DD|nr:fimbrial protein [Citrobacter sp. Cu233]MDM2935770.1 fimbrial protein [Citrobacter sp. Cu233]